MENTADTALVCCCFYGVSNDPDSLPPDSLPPNQTVMCSRNCLSFNVFTKMLTCISKIEVKKEKKKREEARKKGKERKVRERKRGKGKKGSTVCACL